MKTKNKKIVFFAIILVVMFLLLLFIKVKKSDYTKNNYTIPEKTKVILQLSSFTFTNEDFFPSPSSIIYFFDNDGNELKKLENGEEIVGDIIVEGDDKLAFLFKYETVLTDDKGFKTIKSNSTNKLGKYRYGPSQTGYIKDKGLFYSLLNIGYKSGVNGYVFELRFCSEDESYIVDIPYYIGSNIVYDSDNEKFICTIDSSENRPRENTLKYVEVIYNQETQKFEYNDELHKIKYYGTYYNDKNIGYRCSTVKNDCLYSVFNTRLEKNLDKEITLEDNPNEYGNLILTIADLKNKTIESKILKENYYCGEEGLGFITGSPHLPMATIDDKLYVFTYDQEVYIIDDYKNIGVLKMPFEFDDALSIVNLSDKKFKNEKKDFFHSRVKIDNGNIYVLNIYKNKILMIHELQKDGTYKLFWEGKLPKLYRRDLFINTFEIIK